MSKTLAKTLMFGAVVLAIAIAVIIGICMPEASFLLAFSVIAVAIAAVVIISARANVGFDFNTAATMDAISCVFFAVAFIFFAVAFVVSDVPDVPDNPLADFLGGVDVLIGVGAVCSVSLAAMLILVANAAINARYARKGK